MRPPVTPNVGENHEPWYESMSRTPIRDRPLRQPLIRHSRHPLVNPAPHSSFRRRPESRGAGRGECSAGACPPLGSGWGVTEPAVPIRCTKPHLRLFIPSCAGASQHERLVRKHVPDSDPGWMFAVTFVGLGRPGESRHPRHPPRHSRESGNLGEVWVVATTLEHSHQPMHPIFIPRCAGASRHQRLL